MYVQLCVEDPTEKKREDLLARSKFQTIRPLWNFIRARS